MNADMVHLNQKWKFKQRDENSKFYNVKLNY